MDGLIVHCSFVPVKTGKKKKHEGESEMQNRRLNLSSTKVREGGRERREREGGKEEGREGGEGTNQFT